MAKVTNPGVWGIDVGQCALKALRLELIDGQVTATAFDYVEHPKILSQPDADADQLTREALEKFLSRNTLRGDTVAISVPGQGGLARFVKLPPVEEKKITDIVRFEAKQQIPFRLEEVVWDFQKIGSGVVTDGFAMETEIGLFAMKRDMINRYLQHFRDVHVEVQITQLAPLALCNFIAYDLLHAGGDGKAEEGAEDEDGKKACVVALDIGADNSNLVITDGAKIIWQRPIPLGGNHFTRALTKDFKLTFAKAEHLKRNAIKSPELKKILTSLKTVLNDFVGEVQRSLGYFTNTHRDAAVRYMVGLGNAFRLPGLQKFLSEKLQLEVKKLGKLERLSGDSVITAPQYTENVLSFAVAYGLALQGLNMARLHTNLLPQEIQIERLVKAKKPWAAAAAAALLLGVGGLTACLANGYGKFANKAVVDAQKEANRVVSVASDWKGKCDAIEASIASNKKSAYQIAAGQQEQLNWSLLLHYVNESLPRPDGSHIPTKFLDKYYTAKSKAAYKDILEGKSTGEDLQQDLTQVNIEAILPLYTDDVPGFFQRILESKKGDKRRALEGMSAADKDAIINKQPLPKSGWIVELRGYTYYAPWDGTEHVEPRQFLIDTLCENLSRGVQDAKSFKDDKAIIKFLKEDKALAKLPPKEFQKQVELFKKRRDIVWKNVRFVVMYKYDSVKNPKRGEFVWIKQTLLPPLLEAPAEKDKQKGGQQGNAMMNQRGGFQQPAQQSGPKKADRGEWKPVGDLAAAAFEGGKNEGREERKAEDDKGKKKTEDLQRAEFHIFFYWDEPTPSEKEAAGANPGALNR